MGYYLLLVLSLCLFTAEAAPWQYGTASNPAMHWVNLANDPLAVNITSVLKDDQDIYLNNTIDMQFNFYGIPVPSNQWLLDTNGFLFFDNQTTASQPFSPNCPLPLPPNQYPDRGFFFYWTDWCFWCTGAGLAFYRFFPIGSCPYPPKSSEGCLVIDYEQGINNDDFIIGTVNAFVFTSGVMLSQVKYFNSSSPFGRVRNNIGALFGIQDFSQNVAVGYPNSSCAWFNETVLDKTFVDTSDPNNITFSFAFYPPCGVIGDLTTLRPDGLGCGCDVGYYPNDINCMPCPSGQTSDGLTCYDASSAASVRKIPLIDFMGGYPFF